MMWKSWNPTAILANDRGYVRKMLSHNDRKSVLRHVCRYLPYLDRDNFDVLELYLKWLPVLWTCSLWNNELIEEAKCTFQMVDRHPAFEELVRYGIFDNWRMKFKRAENLGYFNGTVPLVSSRDGRRSHPKYRIFLGQHQVTFEELLRRNIKTGSFLDGRYIDKYYLLSIGYLDLDLCDRFLSWLKRNNFHKYFPIFSNSTVHELRLMEPQFLDHHVNKIDVFDSYTDGPRKKMANTWEKFQNRELVLRKFQKDLIKRGYLIDNDVFTTQIKTVRDIMLSPMILPCCLPSMLYDSILLLVDLFKNSVIDSQTAGNRMILFLKEAYGCQYFSHSQKLYLNTVRNQIENYYGSTLEAKIIKK